MARTPSDTGGTARGLVLALAVLLAAGATVTVVLTDDPQNLRLAVIGALWAFVLAALAAPRRRHVAVADEDADGGPGAEAELRRTYEQELEREVAARREYELQLEVYLRREMEQGLTEDVQALREELERLRGELAAERRDGHRSPVGDYAAVAFPSPVPYPPAYGEVGAPPAYGEVGPPPAYGEVGPPPAYGEVGPPAPYGEIPSAPATLPPSPRAPAAAETERPRRRRHRDDGEGNEVMARLLGR